MEDQEISTIDSFLEKTGGCGLFQIVAVLILHGGIMASPWSMLFMAFGSYNPGWTCQETHFNSTSPLRDFNGVNTSAPNTQAGNESSCAVYEQCKNVVYNNGSSTIVTEWNLACDRSWITSMMTTVQMTGVLIGSLFAGHINHAIGRKATLYGTLALHATLNLVASFSVNWPMFTAMRFFLGLTCGSIVLSGFVYPMEFVTNRWRGVVASLPFSPTSNVCFALTAMFLRDWRLIHQATAIVALVLFLPVFWAPDSIRWLAVKNKTKKAEKVGRKITSINRKPEVNMGVITLIGERERRIEESKAHFSILDLYQHGLLKRTLILTLSFLTNTMIYYSILFNVQSLSGNFFINFIIFSALSMICLPCTPLLTNTIGRKWGCIALMGLISICCLILVCLNFIETDIDKELAKLILLILIIIFVESEWSIIMLFCVELYPTVLRSISYSHGSCVARVGGMIAPFLIPRDESTAYISQLIMFALIALTCFCIFFLPETKDQHLEETVTLTTKRRCEQPLVGTVV